MAGEDAGLKESERAGSVRTHVVLVYEGEQLVVVLRLLRGWGVSAGRAAGGLTICRGHIGAVGGEAIQGPATIYSPRHATSPPLLKLSYVNNLHSS